MTAHEILGVGMLRAGTDLQAICLPTVARLADRITITHVTDARAEVAEASTRRVGAAHPATLDELLADPADHAATLRSPSRFHAEQVIAAMRAGKRAVLCDKPYPETREDAQATSQSRIRHRPGAATSSARTPPRATT